MHGEVKVHEVDEVILPEDWLDMGGSASIEGLRSEEAAGTLTIHCAEPLRLRVAALRVEATLTADVAFTARRRVGRLLGVTMTHLPP